MQNGLPDSPRSGRSGVSESGSQAKAMPPGPDLLTTSIVEERAHNMLPTLHEDSEFNPEHAKPVPLTLKALMATKEERLNVDVRPFSGPYSG